jgi:hypothetical protein
MEDHLANSFPFPPNTAPPPNPTYHSHIDPSLHALENGNPFPAQFAPPLDPSHAIPMGSFPQRNATPVRFQDIRSQAIGSVQRQPQEQPLTPITRSNPLGANQVQSQPYTPSPALQRVQDASFLDDASGTPKKDASHFTGMKRILDPPDLEKWRERLFNVDEIIYMTEDE